MHGLHLHILKSISRIRTTFVDEKGNSKSGIGTGFWIELPSSDVLSFITNHQNLNISLKNKNFQSYKLEKVEIEIREVHTDIESNMHYITLQNPQILRHQTADTAMIVAPQLEQAEEKAIIIPCLKAEEWLADASFFNDYVKLGADICFLGYPESFCDPQNSLPIARHAILASYPNISFNHKKILVTDSVLVSGSSFQEASGSPVFIASRGIRINGDQGFIQSADYCPQKLIGVMTGHLQEIQRQETLLAKSSFLKDLSFGTQDELEKESGLSYFTKSTIIWDLINQLKQSHSKIVEFV